MLQYTGKQKRNSHKGKQVTTNAKEKKKLTAEQFRMFKEIA